MSQFCTFRVNGALYGIPVLEIQEVFRYQAVTPAPLAPATIKGLINLRGQIVTAIDLRIRLGLPPRSPDEVPLNIVVRSSDGGASLLVDDIVGVIEVDDSSRAGVPDTVTGPERRLIRGTFKLDKALLLELDTEMAIDTSNDLELQETAQ